MVGFEQVVLATPRLRLRWLTPADAPAQLALHADEEAMRYWSSEPWTTLQQAEDSIAQHVQSYRDGSAMRLAVVLAETDEVIGNVTLYHFFPQNRRCDIGYMLSRPHWGRGYMKEALTAAIDHAFGALDLIRIEADIDPRNAASGRLLESLGFTREGYMRERWIVNGEVCDTAFYGLLKRDWQGRPD